jgi:hypothetical protein
MFECNNLRAYDKCLLINWFQVQVLTEAPLSSNGLASQTPAIEPVSAVYKFEQIHQRQPSERRFAAL